MSNDDPKREPCPPPPDVKLTHATCANGPNCKDFVALTLWLECHQLQRLMHEAYLDGVSTTERARARMLGLRAYDQAQQPSAN